MRNLLTFSLDRVEIYVSCLSSNALADFCPKTELTGSESFSLDKPPMWSNSYSKFNS